MKNIKYKGNYLEVSEEVIGGHTYERVLLRPGVRVYPVKDNKILMINELRKHEGASRWKFIGGWIDKEGKSELEIAKEELLEEVGMESDDWQTFHVFDTGDATIGVTSTSFVAKNPVFVKNPPQNPDSDVVIETKWVSLQELWQIIDSQKVWWDFDTFVAVQVLRNLNFNKIYE